MGDIIYTEKFDKNERSPLMVTKYPIVLVHGVAARPMLFFRAFGRIDSELRKDGYKVFVSNHDGFGRIETNAEQLKAFIQKIMKDYNVDKVNIIAHSKGGLDSKYMITHLDMEDHVASLTTLCTPHRGSLITSKIWDLPDIVKEYLAFLIDSAYTVIGGDKKANAIAVCDQLRMVETSEEVLNFSYKVYCQSYSTNISRPEDCAAMAVPMIIHKGGHMHENDGLVDEESSKFGVYRGSCLDTPVSHVQIIDFLAKKKQRKRVYAFYKQVCIDLANMGF